MARRDNHPLRRKIFVDPKVQGGLLLRAGLYLVCTSIVATVLILMWRILAGGPGRVFYRELGDLWFHYAPVALALLSLAPLLAIDLVRFSNRFAGPMYRMRKTMLDLADGQRVRPLKFRDDDLWKDFADAFNTLLRRVEELEEQVEGGRSGEDGRDGCDESTEADDANRADEAIVIGA